MGIRDRIAPARSGFFGSKCRLGFKYAKLQQHPREFVDPDLARDLVAHKEKQKRAADFESLSGRRKAAEITLLRSYHFYELYRPASINQQMLCLILYIGKGRKPFLIEVLDCGTAFDFAADRAVHVSIFCMIRREIAKS